MKVMQVACSKCAGIGHTIEWEAVSEDRLQSKRVMCEACNGKGYTEYAVFSIEEAEVILKHCGLSTES